MVTRVATEEEAERERCLLVEPRVPLVAGVDDDDGPCVFVFSRGAVVGNRSLSVFLLFGRTKVAFDGQNFIVRRPGPPRAGWGGGWG